MCVCSCLRACAFVGVHASCCIPTTPRRARDSEQHAKQARWKSEAGRVRLSELAWRRRRRADPTTARPDAAYNKHGGRVTLCWRTRETPITAACLPSRPIPSRPPCLPTVFFVPNSAPLWPTSLLTCGVHGSVVSISNPIRPAEILLLPLTTLHHQKKKSLLCTMGWLDGRIGIYTCVLRSERDSAVVPKLI